MGRNIVLCFDGTNNHYAATNTNVVKIYGMLDRTRNDQLTYYHPGIGTFAPPGVWGKTKRWFITKLDLAVAWLLEDHVSDGYRFLMRYYQDGDKIFIFGFSRGAYTARALAAMLNRVGLLTAGNEELLPFAWDMFKRETDAKVYTGFRYTFSRRVPVHFLGLWDTVSSIGWAWNPKYLRYTANNPIVEVVRHAVALDERRVYFPQNLWGHDPKMATDILQVWFPGVHCDVGGGYPEMEGGLSKIALQWMVNQAKGFGLLFQPKAEAAVIPEKDTSDYSAPSAEAKIHESLHGLWWIPEFIPLRRWRILDSIRNPAEETQEHWEKHWIINAGKNRQVNENSNIHESVFERKSLDPTYLPPNLPSKFVKVK